MNLLPILETHSRLRSVHHKGGFHYHFLTTTKQELHPQILFSGEKVKNIIDF
jgi:hypothetical protein